MELVTTEKGLKNTTRRVSSQVVHITNIIRAIKWRKITWERHVARMDEARIA
jgi:hypothetical protein